MPWNSEGIDFISSYCDRWCERCSYTSRCSAYACEAAVAMCGDVAQGLELAIGTPPPVDGRETAEPAAASWLADVDHAEMSAEMQAEFDATEQARDERIDSSPLTTITRIYSLSSCEWLQERYESLREQSDPVVAEALEVVSHDSVFIGAKIHRALHGRDCFLHGEGFEDDPVQNDWNGSAKVAFISLERSEAAWRAIATATIDTAVTILADRAAEMRRLVTAEFPQATAFIRPGFDEPWR